MTPSEPSPFAVGTLFGDEGERDWRGLLTRLDWANGFALLVLLLPARAGWPLCERALGEHLAGRGRGLSRLHYATPEALAALPEEVLARAIPPASGLPVGAVWIDLFGPEAHDRAARVRWEDACRRALGLLNQHRNRLLDARAVPVVFVSEPWLKIAFREAAPDLWSVRETVLTLRPTVAETAVRAERLAETARPEAELRTEAASDPDYAMQLASHYRGKPDAESASALGKLLLRAGAGYHARGNREMAATAGEEAVAVYRDLAARQPDTFRSDLAASLNNLAAFLNALGRREEALGPAEEAVAIWRELAARQPDAFRPDLAVSLNNLANSLSALGRREEALRPAEEAVAIRRELAARQPDAFRPNLAVSLNNLANRLSALGRREEALGLAEEAVVLRRELAARQPDAFRSDLAGSLNNLALRLRALGRREEALGPAEEAVAIRRDLAARQPDAFRPDLAASLNNLANCLSDLGRREEALGPAEEAVDLYRELAARQPDAFAPNLATSLNTMGQVLEANERREEARERFAEGLRVVALPLRRLSAAFAPLAQDLLLEYARMCEALGQEVDMEVAGPVAEVLMAMQSGGEARGDDADPPPGEPSRV